MNASDSYPQLAGMLLSRNTFQVFFESLIYGCIASAAFVGNLLVLYIVYKTPRLRTVPGLFVSSLALSDIFMACLGTPPSLAALIKGRWTSGLAGCQFQGFVVITTAGASLLTMALMAIDRFFRVVRPMKHRILFTMPHAQFMTAAVWILALLTPIPYLGSGRKYVFHPGKFFCFHEEKSTLASGVIYIYVTSSMAVLTFCYFSVFRHLRFNAKRVKNLRENFTNDSNQRLSTEEIKLTRTLFVTVLGYLICWTPILIIDFVDMGLGGGSLSRGTYVFYTNIGLASSSLNPIIYGALNQTFRREYKKLLLFKMLFKQPENSCDITINSKSLDT